MLSAQIEPRPLRRFCFETEQLAELRALLRSRPEETGVGVREGGVARIHETYVDTDDRRFLRAGYTLSIRDDGRRVDALLTPGRAPGDRPHLSVRAPLGDRDAAALAEGCPDPLREPVSAVRGREPLRETLQLLHRRETFHLARDDRSIGSLTLVETLAYRGRDDAPVERAHVELELADGGANGAAALVGLLRSRFGMPQAPGSPWAGALEALGAPGGALPELGSTRVSRKATAGQVAFAVLRKHFRRCLAREPGTRLGVDPEELHDMRVAVRRLRAALRVFRGCLPPGAKELSAELRWLGQALGHVRDLDVQTDWVRSRRDALPGSQREHVRAILDLLREHRAVARRDMLEALDSPRYERLVVRMTKWLRRGPRRRPKRGRKRVRKVAPDLIRGSVRAVHRAGGAIAPSSPPEDYHRLRILTKRARYVLEFHRDVYGKPVRKMIRTLVGLQDLLGEHQDAVVFLGGIVAVLEAQRERLGHDVIHALDPLQRDQLARASELRARFPEAFAAVRGRVWKRLRRAL